MAGDDTKTADKKTNETKINTSKDMLPGETVDQYAKRQGENMRIHTNPLS
jgi:hypothetical protein